MIRWSYGINQFKPQFDDFVRRRQHVRALRIISISGFEGVELNSGTGRWEALGNPQQLAANFGSLAGFREFVEEAALTSVSSWVWDPMQRSAERLTNGFDPTDASATEGLVAEAEWYASALAELGGSVLVARPSPSAWQRPDLDDAALDQLAASWHAVGERIGEHGIRLGLHVDFLSALRTGDRLERLLERTDPALVGLTVDTAEYAIAGRDPAEFIRSHADRVVHVQLKNAAAVDDIDEYLTRNAEVHVKRVGGTRRIPRWFLELGVEPRVVDSAGVVRTLKEVGYDGWIVVESDLSPHPPTTAMLNGWEVQHVLQPILAGTAS